MGKEPFVSEMAYKMREIVRLNVISQEEKDDLELAKKEWNCADGIRPCPFFCRYNLEYEVNVAGGIRVYNGIQGSNCAWDHVTPDGMSAKAVADVMNMHHQRIFQIENSGIKKAAKLKGQVDFLPERRSMGAQCEDAAFMVHTK